MIGEYKGLRSGRYHQMLLLHDILPALIGRENVIAYNGFCLGESVSWIHSHLNKNLSSYNNLKISLSQIDEEDKSLLKLYRSNSELFNDIQKGIPNENLMQKFVKLKQATEKYKDADAFTVLEKIKELHDSLESYVSQNTYLGRPTQLGSPYGQKEAHRNLYFLGMDDIGVEFHSIFKVPPHSLIDSDKSKQETIDALNGVFNFLDMSKRKTKGVLISVFCPPISHAMAFAYDESKGEYFFNDPDGAQYKFDNIEGVIDYISEYFIGEPGMLNSLEISVFDKKDKLRPSSYPNAEAQLKYHRSCGTPLERIIEHAAMTGNINLLTHICHNEENLSINISYCILGIHAFTAEALDILNPYIDKNLDSYSFYSIANTTLPSLKKLEEILEISCNDLHNIDGSDRSFLMTALSEGRDDLVLHSIQSKKLDLTAKDNQGNSALHHAVTGNCSNKINIIRSLVKNNPDCLNQTNKNGHTPFSLAILAGDNDLIKFFQEEFKLKPKSLTEKHLVQILLDEKNLSSSTFDPEILNKAFIIASIKNNVKLMKLLVAKGADINYRSPEQQSAFNIACESGFIESLEYLLSENELKPMIKGDWDIYPELVLPILLENLDRLGKNMPLNLPFCEKVFFSQNINLLALLLDKASKDIIDEFRESILARPKIARRYEHMLDFLSNYKKDVTNSRVFRK